MITDIFDWIESHLQTILTILGFVYTITIWAIQKYWKLPPKYQSIIDSVSYESIAKIITDIAKYSEGSDIQKVQDAAEELCKLATKLGFDLNLATSIIITQYVFNKLKAKKVI